MQDRYTVIDIPRAQSKRRLAPRAFRIGLSTAALCCSSLWTPVQSADLPATKAGQLLGEWVSLCQAPNLEQMTKWMTLNLSAQAAMRFPAQARAQQDFEFCSSNGGLRVMEVPSSAPDAATLLSMGPNTGIWFKVNLTVDAAGKLDRAGNSAVAPAEATMPRDLGDAALARDVHRIVAKLSHAGVFSGIVSVARGTQIIASASAGYADRERKTSLDGATQFTLGSLGKMFTAASVGQLVDKGQISFNDTVGKFFPDYPNHAVRDKVTVGMLLSHTSGMGDFLRKRSPEMMKKGVKRAAEFMPLYDKDDVQFPPGTAWAYSNAGLALAGAIVEKVSGEDYPDYIRKHIFAVAHMTHSDPNNLPHESAKLVTPYTKMTENGPSSDWHEAEHDIGSPAGGAISTADDLVRFAEALRSGKLVSKTTFSEMAKPHATLPSGEEYGYAMQIENTYGRTIVGHGGGFPGVSTHLYLVLDSQYTVVVLANQDPPAAEDTGSEIVALLAEKAKSGT